MIKQQFDRGKINHLLSEFSSDFVISCKSTESIQPDKSAFYNPAKRFGSKSTGSVRCGTYFYVDIEISLYILDKLASVSSVDKSFSYRRPRIGYLLSNGMSHTGIMYTCVAYASTRDKTVAVNRNVAFYALYLLVGIESIVTLTVAPLGALGIKCPDRRGGILIASFTYPHNKFFYAAIQITLCSPFVKIPIDRLPLGKIVWEQEPLTATDQRIQDCLEYGMQGIFAVSAIIFKEYFVYIRPLNLGQMCLIEVDFMHTNRFPSTNTLIEGLLCPFLFNLL